MWRAGAKKKAPKMKSNEHSIGRLNKESCTIKVCEKIVRATFLRKTWYRY